MSACSIITPDVESISSGCFSNNDGDDVADQDHDNDPIYHGLREFVENSRPPKTPVRVCESLVCGS